MPRKGWMLHQASFRRVVEFDASPPLGAGVDVTAAAVAMAGSWWSWCFNPPLSLSGKPSVTRLAIVNNFSVFAATSCCRCRLPRPICQTLWESRDQKAKLTGRCQLFLSPHNRGIEAAKESARRRAWRFKAEKAETESLVDAFMES